MISDWTGRLRTFQRGEGVDWFGHNVLLASLEPLHILSLLALLFKLVTAFLRLLLFLISLQEKIENYITQYCNISNALMCIWHLFEKLHSTPICYF